MTIISLRSISRAMMMPVLAVALSLNPMATGPALAGQNDKDDVGALIAALLGLAVVGTIIAKSNDRDDRRAIPKPRRQVKPRHHAKYKLPNQCLYKHKTQFGMEKYWGKYCLSQYYDFVSSLPRKCQKTIVARNSSGVFVPRHVYPPRCLKEAGYRKRH